MKWISWKIFIPVVIVISIAISVVFAQNLQPTPAVNTSSTNTSTATPVTPTAKAQVTTPQSAPTGKPNIIVIMGDDIGWFNIGAYHQGIMSGRTPHLDQLAREGARYTDYYAEPSCTAGRANFITGELPIRTGLTTVGQAGADVGMPAEAPTIATALKEMGYATGQFGKNHLGDLNKYLPCVHGFDEYFGYLYHLDAMEDPFWHSYPESAKNTVGPRNMLHCYATATADTTVDQRWGQVGKQRIEDAGPLPPERMKTVDNEGFTVETELDWKNTYRVGLGGQYHMTPTLLLQTGVSYDSSPTTTSKRTPDLPVDRQIRAGIGMIYSVMRMIQIGFSYEYINFGDADIHNVSQNGVLAGSYSKNYANVLQASVNVEC